MKKGLIVLILLLVFLFGCVEVVEESDVKTVCMNADDGGLCSGLDFVFGEGYKNICCESFGKCCG